MRRRDEPQFLDVMALPWRHLAGVSLAHGLDARLLSADPDRGAATFMARLPAGWRWEASEADPTVEVFVLQGELEADGKRVGAGGFIALPSGADPRALASPGGAHVYVFWSPGLPPTERRSTAAHREPWIETPVEEFQHGALHRSLRLPDGSAGERHGGPGGVLRMVQLTPSAATREQEVHHSCWEEIIVLAGDLMMPERGYASAGSYIGNPADFWHGPWATQAGNVHLVQTVVPVGIEFASYPGGSALVDDYRDTTSWLAPPEHGSWTGTTPEEAA